MKEKILLIGGGGHCKAAIDVIEQEDKFEIIGIIDQKEKIGHKVFGYEIIGSDDDLEKFVLKYPCALITVGQIQSPKIRITLFNKLKEIGYKLPTVISSLAYVSQYAKIDEGTIVMHHALINSNAKVGKNCIINTKALIEHDAIVEDHCHISTGAIINGGVCVRKNTFYGSNATSKEYVHAEGFIKAGSVVIK